MHMQIHNNAIRNGFWSRFNMKIEPRHDKTNKMICAPSEDSDQPGHPPSLITVSAVSLKQNWVLSYPLSAQRRLRSDWADAQADLSLRWSQNSLCSFCHEVVQVASSSSLYMQHIYISSLFTFRIEPNMKSFSHANNIVLSRDIYIHRLNWCYLIKRFSLANGTWCAVTLQSFDFVKDDCAVGSAVLGKRRV